MPSYERLSLEVEAVFLTNGDIRPKALFCNGLKFDINKIVGIRTYTPRQVACFLPIQYTILVAGKCKEIYFEAKSNTWFSVKERNQ